MHVPYRVKRLYGPKEDTNAKLKKHLAFRSRDPKNRFKKHFHIGLDPKTFDPEISNYGSSAAVSNPGDAQLRVVYSRRSQRNISPFDPKSKLPETQGSEISHIVGISPNRSDSTPLAIKVPVKDH